VSTANSPLRDAKARETPRTESAARFKDSAS
jgi:hypothetical protein